VRHPVRIALFAVTLLAMTGVAGCASRSPTVSFYTLNPEATASGPAVQVAGEPVAVVVGPADFPRALRRSQLATRTGPNQIEFDEFNRWAGSLESDFLGAVGANLSALLGSSRISVYPNDPVFAVNYRVSFEVQRFDADTAGTVTLHARWTLQDNNAGSVLHVAQFSDTRATTSGDRSAVVAAHSELVAALSRDIADQIRRSAGGS